MRAPAATARPARQDRPAPAAARRRDRGRARSNDDEIPIALYGLKRGTVTLLTLLCAAFALFTLIPIAWIMINSTKTQANIFESFGFWFQRPFVLFHNF